MKKIIISSIIALAFIAQPILADEATLNVQIVQRMVLYPTRGNFASVDCPVLSCNDLTYVPVKNVAKRLGYEAIWEKSSNNVYLAQPSADKYLIKTDETALAIGKAIIEEYFADEITESTRYTVSLGYLQRYQFDMYGVYVKFDVQEEFETEEDLRLHLLSNADCIVGIDPVKGEVVSFRCKDENENLKNVLDTILG